MAATTAADRRGITHRVVVDEENGPAGVVCLRVRPSAIDMSTWGQHRPSCPVCARYFDKESV